MRRVAMSRRAALLFAVAVAAALPVSWAAATVAEAAEATTSSLPGRCTSRCGNISIPHPFGVEPGCYLPGLNVTCRSNGSRGAPPPELFLGDGTVRLLEISIPNGTVRINGSFATFTSGIDSNGSTTATSVDADVHVSLARGTWSGALGEGGPYTLAWERNRLLAVACNVQILLVVEPNNATASTCASVCEKTDKGWALPGAEGSQECSGVGCCQANIMKTRSSYLFKALRMKMDGGAAGPSSIAVAWIVDSGLSFNDAFGHFGGEIPELPAVLDWRISHTTCHGNASSAACRSSRSYCANDTIGREGHLCHCDQGYQGNPYIPNGCKDINECATPEKYSCFAKCDNTEGSFRCRCPHGYSGNASIPNGCKDINECAHPDRYPCYGICENLPGGFDCQCTSGTYGDPRVKEGCIPIKSPASALKVGLAVGAGTALMLFALVVPFTISKIKAHKVKRTKERFFKQNHGLLLQQLVSQNSDIGGRMIISLHDLEKATNKFDASHQIGGGGHGVVYKGLLDLQVVAIKKSKIIVQTEINDFINEVAILSQINHRNIVKLLGCCLETEVPLLVYEFVSNGTLADHLHVEGTISLSWDDRLRIVLEISKALAYLHSAASTPVLHRDIKSSNILLDDNLTAKVSDFGASKYIPTDQIGVTTAVQGTIGYLDPMYYYTGRLTDKSDVFSFGVLLIEVLTRKKPSVYRSDSSDSLVSHFASLFTKGCLANIIDPQIMEEEGEQVDEVAKLAATCTKVNGEDRPTMREVEMTIENMRVTKKMVQHSTTSGRKYEKGDQTAARHMSFERLSMETSRQYTVEEEMFSSARYPR